MKYYGILLIAILILLGGCDVKSPVLPKWDVDLAIPLINEKYYVSDLVDSVNILMDEDDVLYLTTTGDVSTPEFGLIPFTPPPSSIVSNQAIYHVPNLPNVSMPFVDQSGKVQFSYAEIATGAFQTKFAATAAGSSVLLHFDNIFHADGSNYEITAENSPNWVVWDLSGCHIGASGSDTIITELTISVTSNSTAPPGTKTGELSILANTPLQFQEFAGKLINTTMELQESLSSIVIEYPQGLNDAVTLESASIKMTLTSGIGFGADFSGQFYAYNDNGTTATVPIKDNQGNNFHIIPGANTLDVSESISDLLSIMPTHIEVRNGIFNIDSGTEVGSVRAGDAINLEYVVKAPFTFTLHNNPIVIQNELDIPISSENANLINKNALGAKLELYITNLLPVGATATAYFSDTPEIDVDNPSTYDYTKEATIFASNTPEGQGEQTVPPITLSESEVKLFGNPNVYLRWKFAFHNSNVPVTIHGSTTDYIQIKGRLSAKIAVED